jgi:Acetylornithine deacetylase/Succinyl-diaminopimelate desuccinylase and related deacylases
MSSAKGDNCPKKVYNKSISLKMKAEVTMDKQNKIDILTHLVQIDSANDHEKMIADYLEKLLTDHGITVKQVETSPGRNNLIAELGEPDATPVFALAGHMDTVSFGNVDDWAHGPLSAEIHGDRLYGRGSADMKGSLAAMVIAMIDLADSKVKILAGSAYWQQLVRNMAPWVLNN